MPCDVQVFYWKGFILCFTSVYGIYLYFIHAHLLFILPFASLWLSFTYAVFFSPDIWGDKHLLFFIKPKFFRHKVTHGLLSGKILSPFFFLMCLFPHELQGIAVVRVTMEATDLFQLFPDRISGTNLTWAHFVQTCVHRGTKWDTLALFFVLNSHQCHFSASDLAPKNTISIRRRGN